jgi:hypothetical protein
MGRSRSTAEVILFLVNPLGMEVPSFAGEKIDRNLQNSVG